MNEKLKEEMDNFVKGQTTSLMSEQKAQGEYFYKHLVKNKPINKIPENVFINYILPFFNPDVKVTEDVYNRFMTNWIALAGAPTLELAVTDHKGDVIFMCPAMFDTSIINATRDITTNKSVSNFFNSYFTHNRLTNGMGNSFFNQNVNSIYKNIVKGHPALDENRRKWEYIFTRYGLMKSNSDTNRNLKNQDLETDDVFD